MSAFLGFESFLISLGSSVQNVQDTFRTALTSYGWQCARQAVIPAAMLGNMGTPANAFDMDATTTANSTNALPLWVGCQTTAPFTPTMVYLANSQNATYAPATFTLDWSDNGSTWTVHQTWTGETNWGARQLRKYTVTGAPAKNYWRINVTAKNGGSYIEIQDLFLVDASNNWISSKNFIDVLPPVSETIGNSTARELVRFGFASNTISLQPIQELLVSLPQLYTFDTATAGAVTLSITINGVTVSYIGSAPNTALQNARGLYEAVKNSVDSNFLAWEWTWLTSLVATPGVGYFLTYKKTPSQNITITSSNITTRLKGTYSEPHVQNSGKAQAQTVTTDLLNGFIYYLQVNARGLALAIKTNAGFKGPIHACYGDNAFALQQLPTADIPSLPVTPIELLVGYDDSVNNTGAFARATHWWGVCYGYSGIITQTDIEGGPNTGNVFTNHIIPGQLQDHMSGDNSYLGNSWMTMRSEGIYSGADSGFVYPVHRLACDPDNQYPYTWGGNTSVRAVGPVYNSLDWYKYVGALSDEQLVFAPSTDFSTTLSSNIVSTDLTVPVASTTGFPSAGYLFIDNEVIQYTGKTSNSFTGCSRGKYATLASTQFLGTAIYIGAWFTKINTGLLMSGYQKPS